jgi:hypothetical protein
LYYRWLSVWVNTNGYIQIGTAQVNVFYVKSHTHVLNEPGSGTGHDTVMTEPHAGTGHDTSLTEPNAGTGHDTSLTEPHSGSGHDTTMDEPHSGTGHDTSLGEPNAGTGHDTTLNEPGGGTGHSTNESDVLSEIASYPTNILVYVNDVEVTTSPLPGGDTIEALAIPKSAFIDGLNTLKIVAPTKGCIYAFGFYTQYGDLA